MIYGQAQPKTVEWATPQAFFDKLNEEFRFTLDPCSTHENAKCVNHYTRAENGLIQNWGGAESILQSAIRKGVAPMGKEVLRGGSERSAGGDAYPVEDGHEMVS